MAASGILPTSQRYVNGVPVPQGRKTLRMKEKYIIFLVFATFGTVCFGAFFFLPDLREKVRVDNIRSHLKNEVDNLVIPRPDGRGGGKVIRHGDEDGVDTHRIEDKAKLHGKIEEQKQRDKILGDKLKLSKDEVQVHLEEKEKEKEELRKQREEERLKKQKEKEEKAKEVEKHHDGGEGAQGGEPKDEDVKSKRDTIREVT